ncbi:hypothetical protein EIK77_004676 [Talaromyces pinophilus]|nr:hypothetical protein EIK77_004676 [Talaromyces pinophilus]
MPSIQKAIEDDPDISEKMLREQFEKLILQPLLGTKCGQTSTMVIVIDALDECEQEDDIRLILQLLPQVQKSNSVQLRFLLTSRPYLPLKLGFKGIMNDYQGLILHEIPQPVIEHDISLYIKDKFSQLRMERSLPSDWPGDETIKTLVQRAVPLFISAATLYRFISDTRWNPQKRLEAILADQTIYLSRMDSTYMPVLNQLLAGQDEWESQQLVQEFKEIVGVIILLAHPLSVNALAQLLKIRISDINNRLSLLQSVLDIPGGLDAPVRLLHLSFRDFLLDSKKKDSSRFWIDGKATHRKITIQCLEIMNYGLKKNICNLPNEGTKRTEVDISSVYQYLPSELQYSCHYWAQHLMQSEDPLTELDNAFPFLEKHFLHWVEAMSMLGAVSDVVGIINSLQSIIPVGSSKNAYIQVLRTQQGTNSKIAIFLHDARRFILRNRQIAHDSPLQLYCSGLIFAPKNSVIRRMFIEELPSWTCRLPNVEDYWSAELQTLEGHSQQVQSVVFSPDGRLLASGSSDKTIKLWDPATGSLQQTLEGHSEWVQSVAFSPDGRLLASGSWDKTIKLWDPATGAPQQTLEGHSQRVQSVVFSPDGRLLASGAWDNTIKLWDPATGALQQTLEGHSQPFWSVAFSPDGRLLASGSWDKIIKLWDPATGAPQQTLEGHSEWVQSVAFSPDGRLLASGSSDNTIKLWDPATGALQQTLEGHSQPVQSVAFSPDGRLLASGSWDKIIKLWDPATGAPQQTLEGHSRPVQSVAFSPDGRLLASGCWDKTIKLWDPAMGAPQQTLEGHSRPVQSVAFSPDGQLLASGSWDNTIKLWDLATGAPQQTLEGHSQLVQSVVFSPDGRLLASGSSDKTIKLWDLATGALQQTLEGHSGLVQSVAFSPDGRLLASGSSDKTIKLWDLATGAPQQTLEGHSQLVQSVVFSPDGRLLASGCWDKIIKLWDLATGALQQTLEGHSGLVQSVAFSPDGRLLASGSSDKTIKLWDLATGALQQTLTVGETVTNVKFSEDSLYLSTNLGLLKIQPWYYNKTSYSPKTNVEEVSIRENQWITVLGKRRLWLPPEYRPTCSTFKVDGTFILGHASGKISSMRVGTQIHCMQ